MDTSGFDHFFSDDTLAEEFKLVQRKGDEAVWIRQDHTMAIIGVHGTRDDDNKPGIHVVITLDFKEQMISNSNPGLKLPGALQVDLVTANKPNMARSGAGSKLYIALVEQLGVTIISDNTQYRGGKELWKNLARRQGNRGYVINIIEDGKPRMDEKTGKPFVYNGMNLPDDELWSARPLPKTMPSGLTSAGVEQWKAKQAELAKIPDKTMTLFVMRKK
jgi:hypothetical protein